MKKKTCISGLRSHKLMHTKNSPLNCLSPSEWNAFINSIIRKSLTSFSRGYDFTELEDIRQEAWIGLLAAGERFDPSKSKFTTYAYYYVRGHILRFVNKKSKMLSEEDDLSFQEAAYYDTRVETKDLRKTILDSVSDQPYKDLLIERFVKEKSLRTIAKEQGVSHEIISSRIKKLLFLLEKRVSHENA